MTVINFSAERAKRKGRPAPSERDEKIAFLVRKFRLTCSESRGLDDLDEAIAALDARLEQLSEFASVRPEVNLFRNGE